MDTEFKKGELTYLHRGLLSKKWKKAFFVLYSDSSLEWFSKPNDKTPIGTIILRDVFEYIYIGQYTRCMPNRPFLPQGGVETLLTCIPKNYKRKESSVLWISFKDFMQLSDWMKSIDSTLGLLSISSRISDQIEGKIQAKVYHPRIREPIYKAASTSNMTEDLVNNSRINKRYSTHLDPNRIQVEYSNSSQQNAFNTSGLKSTGYTKLSDIVDVILQNSAKK